MAEFAVTALDIILLQEISLPFYENLPTMVAVRVATGVTGHIAYVNVVDPLLEGNAPEALKRRDRCRREPC